MLVLNRKEGEIIRIGDDITIRVQEIVGNKVRLEIQAPQSVKILRQELVDRIDPRANGDNGPTV